MSPDVNLMEQYEPTAIRDVGVNDCDYDWTSVANDVGVQFTPTVSGNQAIKSGLSTPIRTKG